MTCRDSEGYVVFDIFSGECTKGLSKPRAYLNNRREENEYNNASALKGMIYEEFSCDMQRKRAPGLNLSYRQTGYAIEYKSEVSCKKCGKLVLTGVYVEDPYDAVRCISCTVNATRSIDAG